ncbi:hypothetical protein RF007C_05380 [Ruminococcus flavefaciens 007c]|uniref:Uncharacterized protein n=1 Tax=Ruminococcus flavefaciens 007c TaxID=1341157 RepID=W7V2C9_RUMFL|nr:hypothetical protein RF007C_05380 [Ruminococcus flavefaciens 007c]
MLCGCVKRNKRSAAKGLYALICVYAKASDSSGAHFPLQERCPENILHYLDVYLFGNS